MGYVSENHSKYLLMVHLIFVVKYRRNLLVKFGDEIKQIFYDIADEKNISIVEMEVDKNHIHLLVHYKPNMSVLDIVRWFKQISTYRIWRKMKKAALILTYICGFLNVIWFGIFCQNFFSVCR